MYALTKRFIANNAGATAIEYGLIAGLIGISIIGVMQTLGVSLVATFVLVEASL